MSKKWWRLGRLWGLLGLGSALLAACGGGAETTPPKPEVPAVVCRLSPEPQSSDVLGCGDVEVPLRYDDPTGPKLKLNYVIFRGESAQKSRDVIVLIQGGPGLSVTSQVWQVRGLLSQLRPNADLLLFEQRGVGVNTPSLNCPVEPALASVQKAAFRAQAQACLERFKVQGLQLSDFNTRANADDIATLVAALGYEKANLYGMSYGSRVAQEVVRRHPSIVRSVILDGVLDPAVSWASQQTRFLQETLGRFGQACAAAGRCADADLPERIQRDADLLESLGLNFTNYNPQEMKDVQLPLNGDVLLSAVHGMAYTAPGMLSLSRLLDAIEARDVHTIEQVPWHAKQLWDGLNMGAFFAFACQDNALDIPSIEAAHAGLLPVFARRGELYKELAGMCREAGLTTSPDALTPVSSDIPTLLISGRFDAVTPPEMAERVGARFPNSRHVIFADGGHVNGAATDCGMFTMLYFVNSLTLPETTCAAKETLFAPGKTP